MREIFLPHWVIWEFNSHTNTYIRPCLFQLKSSQPYYLTHLEFHGKIFSWLDFWTVGWIVKHHIQVTVYILNSYSCLLEQTHHFKSKSVVYYISLLPSIFGFQENVVSFEFFCKCWNRYWKFTEYNSKKSCIVLVVCCYNFLRCFCVSFAVKLVKTINPYNNLTLVAISFKTGNALHNSTIKFG